MVLTIITVYFGTQGQTSVRLGDVAERSKALPARKHKGLNLYRGFESLRLRQLGLR